MNMIAFMTDFSFQGYLKGQIESMKRLKNKLM